MPTEIDSFMVTHILDYMNKLFKYGESE